MKAKWITSVIALALGCATLGQTPGQTQSAQPAAQNAPVTNPRQSYGQSGSSFGQSGSSFGQSGSSFNSYGGISAGGGGGYGGMAGGRSSASYATRLNSIVARAGASSSNPATVIAFEPMPGKALEEMQEDLKVFGLIMYRALERAMGDRSTEYKLGVPMLLQGEHRVVNASYLDGFGVVVKVTVPFPVAAAEGEAKVKRDTGTPATEWEKARRALLGVDDSDQDAAGSPAVGYDEKLVAGLKKEMFESLKNGSNVRHVKDGDWISVVIIGAASNSDDLTSPRNSGSILSLRVKKTDLDKPAEQLEQVAQTTAYLDASDRPQPMLRHPVAR